MTRPHPIMLTIPHPIGNHTIDVRIDGDLNYVNGEQISANTMTRVLDQSAMSCRNGLHIRADESCNEIRLQPPVGRQAFALGYLLQSVDIYSGDELKAVADGIRQGLRAP